MGVYFNAEMTAEQQAIRLAADIAHAMGMPIKHRDIKKGALDNQQRAELKKVRERAKLLPVKFIPTGRVNVKRIISLAAQQKALCEAQGRTLDFVVVDYLGLLGATSADGKPITHSKRSEEHTSELQSLMRTSYAVFCLKKKKN